MKTIVIDEIEQCNGMYWVDYAIESRDNLLVVKSQSFEDKQEAEIFKNSLQSNITQ